MHDLAQLSFFPKSNTKFEFRSKNENKKSTTIKSRVCTVVWWLAAQREGSWFESRLGPFSVEFSCSKRCGKLMDGELNLV